MQVATGRRRWMTVLAALSVVLCIGILSSAQASDPIVRFFGFKGDVTIDGAPVGSGTVIMAMVGEKEVGSTTVNQAGAWMLDVNSSDLRPDACGVTFVVDGVRAPDEWDCAELRVQLALLSAGQERDSGSSPESEDGGERSEPDSGEPDSGEPAEESATDGSPETAEDDAGDEMEAEDSAEESDEPTETIVRPAAPGTGTGGALDDGDSTNWPLAAAITALMTFGVAVMALLLSRRTNSAN